MLYEQGFVCGWNDIVLCEQSFVCGWRDMVFVSGASCVGGEILLCGMLCEQGFVCVCRGGIVLCEQRLRVSE